MWKYTVQVDGMMCGMCESHVNDAVRRALPVKKVSSSRGRGATVVVSEQELDETALGAAIAAAVQSTYDTATGTWKLGL